jgi:hypothetical protein
MIRIASFCVLGLTATLALSVCRETGSRGPLSPASTTRSGGRTMCTPPAPDSVVDLPIEPRESRVDLVVPAFTNPTNITNPLFPINLLKQVVLVGYVGGMPFRSETTLLGATAQVDLIDHTVTTARSQYVAYLDRRIEETALDLYAQGDDGSVWRRLGLENTYTPKVFAPGYGEFLDGVGHGCRGSGDRRSHRRVARTDIAGLARGASGRGPCV